MTAVITTPPGNRARAGAVAFGAAALLCAAGATFVVARIFEARGLSQERRVPVVVASRPIAAAERLSAASLKVAQWPEANVPPGAFSDLSALLGGKQRPVAATGVQANEPIVRARLASASHGTAMAALVQTGKRAIAVKVDNAVTRARLIYPGAYIDLVGTMRGDVGHRQASRIIVERVRVLSVEEQTNVETFRSQPSGRAGALAATRRDAVVTVEVTPEQLELVILASHGGTVDVALRNASDTRPAKTFGATPGQIQASPSARQLASSRVARELERRPKGRRITKRRRQRAELRAATRAAKVKDRKRPPEEIEVYHAR